MWASGLLVVFAALALLGPEVARAGTYVVAQCHDPASGASLSASSSGLPEGWSFVTANPQAPGESDWASFDTCGAPGGAFGTEVANASGNPDMTADVSQPALGEVVFSPPAGLSLAGWGLWRAARTPEPNSTYSYVAYEPQQTNFCHAYFQTSSACPQGDTSLPYGASNHVTGGPAATLTYREICDAGVHCPRAGGISAQFVYASRLTLEDDSPPVFTSPPSGTLFSPTASGIGSVSFQGGDRGGGLRSAVLLVDGTPAASRSLDTGSGTCAVAVFTRLVPCPLSAAGSLSLDTARFADGAHLVTMRLLDAAGNPVDVARSVVFANHASVHVAKVPNRFPLDRPAPCRGGWTHSNAWPVKRPAFGRSFLPRCRVLRNGFVDRKVGPNDAAKRVGVPVLSANVNVPLVDAEKNTLAFMVYDSRQHQLRFLRKDGTALPFPTVNVGVRARSLFISGKPGLGFSRGCMAHPADTDAYALMVVLNVHTPHPTRAFVALNAIRGGPRRAVIRAIDARGNRLGCAGRPSRALSSQPRPLAFISGDYFGSGGPARAANHLASGGQYPSGSRRAFYDNTANGAGPTTGIIFTSTTAVQGGGIVRSVISGDDTVLPLDETTYADPNACNAPHVRWQYVEVFHQGQATRIFGFASVPVPIPGHTGADLGPDRCRKRIRPAGPRSRKGGRHGRSGHKAPGRHQARRPRRRH